MLHIFWSKNRVYGNSDRSNTLNCQISNYPLWSVFAENPNAVMWFNAERYEMLCAGVCSSFELTVGNRYICFVIFYSKCNAVVIRCCIFKNKFRNRHTNKELKNMIWPYHLFRMQS